MLNVTYRRTNSTNYPTAPSGAAIVYWSYSGCPSQADVRLRKNDGNRWDGLGCAGCRCQVTFIANRKQRGEHKEEEGRTKANGAVCEDCPVRTFLVGAIGLEPTTPTMSRWCSNQLSYAPEEQRILARHLPTCNIKLNISPMIVALRANTSICV